MNRYKERISNIEGSLGYTLSLDEKLEIAFEEQSRSDFIELLCLGANVSCIIEKAKRMGGGRLSMYQCDLLKLIAQYQ